MKNNISRTFTQKQWDDEDEEAKEFGEKSKNNANKTALGQNLKLLNFCPDIHEFSWDPDNSSKEISFSSDNRHAFLLETNYLFRTMISNRPFMDG